MPTIEQIGVPSNRELLVEDTYNNPENGYIPLLQKQIENSLIDALAANQNLQDANAKFIELKDNLTVLESVGIYTGNIKPIQNWQKETRSIGGLSLKSIVPAPFIIIPNPISAEAAETWANQAKKSIQTINSLYPEFDSASQIGFQVSKDKPLQAILGHDNIMSIWGQTFEELQKDLAKAVSQLFLNAREYDSAVAAAKSAILTQEGIVQIAQDALLAANAKITELNKQMVALRMQYHTMLIEASDRDDMTADNAIKLALQNDPEYQKLLVDQKQAMYEADLQLERDKVSEASEIEQAKILAAADVQKAQIEADKASAAAILAAQSNTAASLEAEKAQSRKIMVIGVTGIVAILITGIVLIYIFRDK